VKRALIQICIPVELSSAKGIIILSSISILLNPAKFHAKYVSGKSSGIIDYSSPAKRMLTYHGSILSIQPNVLSLKFAAYYSEWLIWPTETTAGPSTPFGAKYAPNSAQDDSVFLYPLQTQDTSSPRPESYKSHIGYASPNIYRFSC